MFRFFGLMLCVVGVTAVWFVSWRLGELMWGLDPVPNWVVFVGLVCYCPVAWALDCWLNRSRRSRKSAPAM